MLRRATEIAPDFAAAWVSLAVAYNHQATYRLITADEARELSLQALEQTLRIDPDSPDAYLQLAIIASNEGDLPGAAGSYERALELQPTTGTLANAASLLEWLGRLDESIRLQEYCMARDPTNAGIFNNLGIVYRYANRLEEARSTLSTALALNPGMMGVRYELGVVDLLDGRPEAAVDSFQQEDAEVFRQLGLAMAAHALGHDGESDRLLREVSSKYGEYVAYFIAQAHAWRGEPDEAFDWLEQAKSADWRDLNSAVNEPLLRSLYGDPRWLKFLQSIGRDPERLAAIRFEVPPPETF
jgi:serine/threonine-protein kinase